MARPSINITHDLTIIGSLAGIKLYVDSLSNNPGEAILNIAILIRGSSDVKIMGMNLVAHSVAYDNSSTDYCFLYN